MVDTCHHSCRKYVHATFLEMFLTCKGVVVYHWEGVGKLRCLYRRVELFFHQKRGVG